MLVRLVPTFGHFGNALVTGHYSRYLDRLARLTVAAASRQQHQEMLPPGPPSTLLNSNRCTLKTQHSWGMSDPYAALVYYPSQRELPTAYPARVS